MSPLYLWGGTATLDEMRARLRRLAWYILPAIFFALMLVHAIVFTTSLWGFGRWLVLD